MNPVMIEYSDSNFPQLSVHFFLGSIGTERTVEENNNTDFCTVLTKMVNIINFLVQQYSSKFHFENKNNVPAISRRRSAVVLEPNHPDTYSKVFLNEFLTSLYEI